MAGLRIYNITIFLFSSDIQKYTFTSTYTYIIYAICVLNP